MGWEWQEGVGEGTGSYCPSLASQSKVTEGKRVLKAA